MHLFQIPIIIKIIIGLDKASLLEIGIRDTDDEYIVNYVSGEVINITKKKTTKGNVLYIRANSFYQ